MLKIIFIILFLLFSDFISAREINIKSRKVPVDVDNGYFKKYELKQSSKVHELYYDRQNEYLIVRIDDDYIEYCNVPNLVVRDWLEAHSLGDYLKTYVRDIYDCRIDPKLDYLSE